MDLRRREKGVREQAARVARARGEREAEASDDPQALAVLAAQPVAAPLTPGRHLGVAAQPKRKKKHS